MSEHAQRATPVVELPPAEVEAFDAFLTRCCFDVFCASPVQRARMRAMRFDLWGVDDVSECPDLYAAETQPGGAP